MNDFINMLIGHVTNSFVSTFVLGILTGWLIEWLFYNFIWKKSRTTTKPEAKSIVETQVVTNEKTKKVEQVSTEIKEDAKVAPKVDIKEESEVDIKDESEVESKVESKAKQEEKSSDPDDFTKLVGIGPSMDKRLKQIKIKSFLQLSEISVDTLMEQLTATGARVNNKTLMKSWAKQAILANSGDFDALKIFQNTLKKG